MQVDDASKQLGSNAGQIYGVPFQELFYSITRTQLISRP